MNFDLTKEMKKQLNYMIAQFQPMVDCVSMVVALWFYRRIL